MYVCVQYAIRYLIQSCLHTSSHVHPIAPHAQSCSCPIPIPCRRHILFCAADPTLQVSLSFLHSAFSGSSHRRMSLHSALVHWTADKRLNELLVSPMIENEVGVLDEHENSNKENPRNREPECISYMIGY
jgi:hypothetical protein